MKKPAITHKDTKEQIVISGVPKDLVESIEKIAKRENRSRAAQVRVLLAEIVAAREASDALPSAA